MIFVDVDEYIYPVSQEENSILPMLNKYETYEDLSAIRLKMIWYGNSGHKNIPSGYITEKYTRRSRNVIEIGREKCIVRPDLVSVMYIHNVKRSNYLTRVYDVDSNEFRINHYSALNPTRRKANIEEYDEVEDNGMQRFVAKMKGRMSFPW